MHWIIRTLGWLQFVQNYRTRRAHRLEQKLTRKENLNESDQQWLATVGYRYHHDVHYLLRQWAQRGEAKHLLEAFRHTPLSQVTRIHYVQTCLASSKSQSRLESLELLYEVYGPAIPPHELATCILHSEEDAVERERIIWRQQERYVQLEASHEIVRQNRIRFLASLYDGSSDLLMPLVQEWMERFWTYNCKRMEMLNICTLMCIFANDVQKAKEMLAMLEETHSYKNERKELINFLYRIGALVFVSLEGATPVPHQAQDVSAMS